MTGKNLVGKMGNLFFVLFTSEWIKIMSSNSVIVNCSSVRRLFDVMTGIFSSVNPKMFLGKGNNKHFFVPFCSLTVNQPNRQTCLLGLFLGDFSVPTHKLPFWVDLAVHGIICS